MNQPEPIRLAEKFALFSELWRPKTVAEANGQQMRLVKLKGVFPWHHHESEDEIFLVWRGRLQVEFRDHAVELDPGDVLVVPRGVEHRTAAEETAEVILIEPASTRNTGNVTDADFTAPADARI